MVYPAATMSERLRELQLAARARRQELDRQVGFATALARRGKALEEELSTLTEDIEVYAKVNALLTSMGDERQSEVQSRIENLVTHGLRVIYDENMSFHIEQDVKRNQSAVTFHIKSSIGGRANVVTPVLNARGGGIVATVSFVLRVVVALLSDRKPVFVFDEVFAHVSPDYELRVAEFLRDLCDQVGIQVIMVTHSDAYSDLADTAYRFSLENGESVIERVK
jgi:DNA repair ATPase RecN